MYKQIPLLLLCNSMFLCGCNFRFLINNDWTKTHWELSTDKILPISGLDYEISKSMYRDTALGCWVCTICNKTSNKKNNIETHIEAGTKTFADLKQKKCWFSLQNFSGSNWRENIFKLVMRFGQDILDIFILNPAFLVSIRPFF